MMGCVCVIMCAWGNFYNFAKFDPTMMKMYVERFICWIVVKYKKKWKIFYMNEVRGKKPEAVILCFQSSLDDSDLIYLWISYKDQFVSVDVVISKAIFSHINWGSNVFTFLRYFGIIWRINIEALKWSYQVETLPNCQPVFACFLYRSLF